MQPEIIHKQWFIKLGEEFFVISAIDNDGRPECLAFAGNKKGEITDFSQLAGGGGMTHEEVLDELVKNLKREEAKKKLRERLMKEDWGYTYQMSDYATSTEQEKEIEERGLEKLEWLIDDILRIKEIV